MSFLSTLWARIAAAAAAVGAIVAAVLVFVWRAFKAGRAAERAKSAQAALEHQVSTAKQVSRSDDAVADPRSERARRVRKLFQRKD